MEEQTLEPATKNQVDSDNEYEDDGDEEDFLDQICDIADINDNPSDQEEKDDLSERTTESQSTILCVDSSLTNMNVKREGMGPHQIFKGLIRNTHKQQETVNVFLDSGSGPSWVKDRCAKRYGLKIFPTSSPTRVSGVGKGYHLVENDARIKIALLRSDGSTTTIETIAGIVPDNYSIPTDILLGRAIHQRLGIQHLPDGSLKAHALEAAPVFSPIANSAIYPLAEKDGNENPLELTIWKKQFPTLFDPSATRSDPVKDHGVRHCIDTDDIPPINIPARTYSPAQTTALEEFVAKGLKDKAIRESDSPWSSPALIVSKKDGRPRTCIDYRALNKRTRKNAFPLPHTNVQIHKAAGHKLYTAIDLADGFWQIRMSENSIERTAFTTHDGHYEWLVMPFGLSNSPATFETALRRVIWPHREYTARLLDDILVFSDEREDHVQQVSAVLQDLYRFGFSLQMRKCKWFASEVIFLGFVIDRTGIKPDPAKVDAVRRRELPTTVTDIRSFLNAAGYMRQFIPHFATLASPLYELTKGSPRPGTGITISDPHRKAFDSLKNALVSAPVLKPIQFGLPVVIDTDASNTCLGAVLQQAFHDNDNGKSALHPIAYESHKLTTTQTRYSAQEKELLAIVFALTTWRTWVEGVKIIIRTDHQSLTRLRTKADLPPRINRFLDFLEHFDPNIIYRKGSLNHFPDWLSRPQQPVDSPSAPKEMRIMTISDGHDPSWNDTLRISDFFINDNNDALNNDEKKFAKQHFATFDNKLFRRRGTTLLEIENDVTLLEIAEELHRKLGHGSAAVVKRELDRRYWHPSLTLVAQESLRRCSNCTLRLPQSTIGQTIEPIPPTAPFARWGLDFTGPCSIGNDRRHILNAIDYATSWAYSISTTNATARDVITILSTIINLHGAPREIVTDNGAQFISHEVTSYLKPHNIIHRKTTPYHPQSNGRCERFNGVLKQILYGLVQHYPALTFDILLNVALNIYRHRTLPHGYSPYFLVFGCLPPQSDTAAIHTTYAREPTPDDETEQANFLRYTRERDGLASVRTDINNVKFMQNTVRSLLAEKKAMLREFQLGDWVLRKREKRHKQEPWVDGPHQVTKCFPNKVYSLRTMNGDLLKNNYHADRLFPAYSFEQQPIDSPWYASKKLLQHHRNEITSEADLPVDQPPLVNVSQLKTGLMF